MKLDRPKLQKEIHELYAREHAALGESGTLALLEKADNGICQKILPKEVSLFFHTLGWLNVAIKLRQLYTPALIAVLIRSLLSACSTLLRMRWKRHA